MKKLLDPYPVDAVETIKMEGYGSENYKITDQAGRSFVLKYYKDPSKYDLVGSENRLVEILSENLPFSLSRPAFPDLGLVRYKDGSFSRVLHFIEGSFLAEVDHSEKLLVDLGQSMAKLNVELLKYRDPVIESYRHSWDLSRCLTNWASVRFIEPSGRKLVDYFFDQYQHFVQPQIPELRHSIIHNDWNDWNILTRNERVCGLLDFGDMCYAPLINELAIALAYVMMSKENPISGTVPIVEGYCQILPLTEIEISILYYLIAARLCQSVCHSAEKKAKGDDTEYILISEKPAWELLEKWPSISPVDMTKAFLQAGGLKKRVAASFDHVRNLRTKNLSSSLSLSYEVPVYMSGASFQYMYDAYGNTYLDAYNNIPHVGHCHPRVSLAISKQIRRLNTNTRYLYDSIAEYAEKLLSYFPEKLNKVFFVNSGSAASDLAIRLANTFTHRNHILVLEHGYHGNTRLGIEISSYKFDGKGGKGASENVTTLPLPKTYHGIFESGAAYANDAIRRIDLLLEDGTHPSAFIAESISGCGGQVPLADGYLKSLKSYLDRKDILCIMDEVQVGFGRVGHHFWGYERHGIIPDIVILGKPMGNGHPIGAVVTTSEIADAFDNGMEFFSSFGGNPVSMEAAKAVLEVIEEEGLQENALEVGRYFEHKAREYADEAPYIGDIRCEGLFLGIEFTNPETGKPATEYASFIKNQMKENYVLTSTDGPYDNVLKMKPPLCFNRENVDRYFEVFVQLIKGKDEI